MAISIRCLGDNLDTADGDQTDGYRHSADEFSSRAEANYSHPQGLRKALQMGKSLETTSMQRTDFGLMAVLQRIAVRGLLLSTG